MSELHWAVLSLDGNRCENCGTLGIHTIDFGICRRVCRACKRQKKEYTEYDAILLDMIPYINIGGWARGDRSGAKYYWLDDIVDMSKKWATLQNTNRRRIPGAQQKAAEFYEARKDLVEAITMGVYDYEVWHDGLKHAQQAENTVRERLVVRRRPRSLGTPDSGIESVPDSGSERKHSEERSWTSGVGC